jgi:hypothetical protein
VYVMVLLELLNEGVMVETELMKPKNDPVSV